MVNVRIVPGWQQRTCGELLFKSGRKVSGRFPEEEDHHGTWERQGDEDESDELI